MIGYSLNKTDSTAHQNFLNILSLTHNKNVQFYHKNTNTVCQTVHSKQPIKLDVSLLLCFVGSFMQTPY